MTTDFTGEGLIFSLAGAGVSVDPTTGEFRIPTDAFREGVELIVTAGGATHRFRVSVVAEPALEAPALVAPPRLIGTGRIGEAVELDPGVWRGTPAPELAAEWRRDGAAIPGATGLSYLPVAADDRTDLTARVVATNAAGSAAAETAALGIVRVAPAVVGALADLALVQGGSPAQVEAAAAFTGAALVYSVAGGGATVDAATGRVTVPTGAPLAGAQVTVTATNSGGSASVSFKVTVAVAAPAAVGTLPDVSYTQGTGTKTVATAGAFSGAGVAYALMAAPAGVTINAATGVVSIPTSALLAASVTVRASNASGSASQSFDVTVRAAASGGFPQVPSGQLGDAIAKPLTKFTAERAGAANNQFVGPAMVIEAYAAFAGQTAADAHVAAQIRYNLQGANCPGGSGGYGLQYQTWFACAAAIVRRTPRLWDGEFTASERTRIELLVKHLAIAGAAQGSDHNPLSPGEKCFLGQPDYGTGGNVNFRNAKPVAVLAARSIVGTDALTSFFNGLDHAAWSNTLNANGLANARTVANNTGTWSHADRESAVRNWTNKGSSLSQFQAIARRLHEEAFNKTINDGLNGGQGILVGGERRGCLISNPNPGRPEKGQLGMVQELDTTDAEGPRSAMSYSMNDIRLSMILMLVMMADGTLDRNSAETQTLKNRLHRGMADYKYKSDNGYKSHSKGGNTSNNEDWTASSHASSWGWSYNFGVWFDVIKPWLDAA
jgi:hypothetical protein